MPAAALAYGGRLRVAGVQKKKAAPPLGSGKPKLTRQGQNAYHTALCIATCSNGKPCSHLASGIVPGTDGKNANAASAVPYCAQHMRNGDSGAVKAIPHPTNKHIGRILIATRDLPKGYRFAYWGTRGRWTPKGENAEFAMEFKPNCGVIDPTPHGGSLMQCAGHPGPDEARNLAWGDESFGTRYDDVVGRELRLCQPVPKGHQVVLNYGADWMKTRPGIPYSNIGTAKYPAPPAARLVRAAGRAALGQVNGTDNASKKQGSGKGKEN